MPASLHNQSETQHWTSPFNLLPTLKHGTGYKHSQWCPVPTGINPSQTAMFGRLLFPWIDTATNEYAIRNPSKTPGGIAKSVTKRIAAQENLWTLLHKLYEIRELLLITS